MAEYREHGAYGSCGCGRSHEEGEHRHEHSGHKAQAASVCAHSHEEGHSGHGSCGHSHEHGDHRHEHGEHSSCGHSHEHGSCGCAHEHSSCGCGCEHSHGSSNRMIVQFGISAVFFAAGLAAMGFGFNPRLFGFGRFELALTPFLFIVSWAAAGYGVLFLSLRNIARGKVFDENFLMSVATIGAFFLGEWTEGAAVMLFYNLGELVQHSAVDKSRRSILGLMELRPDFARLYDPAQKETGDTENCVDPATVKTGSLILVKPGEKIPLDGIVTEGSAELDTSSMTGESVPRSVETGEKVLAGFVNLTGIIAVKTTAELEDSAASKMLELIENAQNRKAKVERFITSFARIYTPIVTIGAVLISVLPPLLAALIFAAPLNGWAGFAPWISRGLVFLVISCPCALVISVPLGYFGGIGGAAKRGILIKGADYIDALSKTEAVVFDKTGTLTKGVLKVMALFPAHGMDKDGLLTLAAVAELNSHHPIAHAIRECAAVNLPKDGYEHLLKAELKDYTEKAGMGLSMMYGGKPLFAGKNSFISRMLNAEIPQDGDEIGGTQVYVAYDGKYVGALVLTDTVKPDAREAVAALKRIGVNRVEMLTGDNEKSARATAEDLGIDRFTALLLPHEKVERFEKIAKEVKGRNKRASVVFVGDGINDAPVLARADAGIAMGGIGSDAAIEAADAVLMNDSPTLIAEAVRLARFTRKIVKENIALAFIIKIGFLVFGALGFVNLWAAVFADVGVALLAVLNSLRAKR